MTSLGKSKTRPRPEVNPLAVVPSRTRAFSALICELVLSEDHILQRDAGRPWRGDDQIVGAQQVALTGQQIVDIAEIRVGDGVTEHQEQTDGSQRECRPARLRCWYLHDRTLDLSMSACADPKKRTFKTECAVEAASSRFLRR